jgi:hypothetical protein
MIRWPILHHFFNFNSNLNDKLSMLNCLQLTTKFGKKNLFLRFLVNTFGPSAIQHFINEQCASWATLETYLFLFITFIKTKYIY